MKKIPLEDTIAGGYRFLFTRIVSVIGTLWFPYLLLAALAAACGYLVLPHEIFRGDFSHIDPVMFLAPQVHAMRFLFGIASVIIGAMVTVNLMRHALGLKQTTTFFYFSLAAPVWRMTGAVVLGVLLLVVSVVVLALGGVAAGYAAFQHMQTAAAIATSVLIGAACISIVIYCFARLFFFLPAVVVAEDRIGLGRSWSLSGGNFWRIAAVWLLIALPVWFVMGVVLQLTILPVVLSQAIVLPRHPEAEELKPLFHAVFHALPVLFTVMSIAGIALRAMMAGAIGTAYKAITAPKEETPSA